MNFLLMRWMIFLIVLLTLVSCEQRKDEQEFEKVVYYLQMTSEELNNGMKSVDYLKEYQKQQELIFIPTKP